MCKVLQLVIQGCFLMFERFRIAAFYILAQLNGFCGVARVCFIVVLWPYCWILSGTAQSGCVVRLGCVIMGRAV